ncbi:hypothetical protein ASF22_02640 [Methylobacterium sp. Leaf87]|uniref:hypothetical protein n=1 Tax=Methylobacterium sp. Leaf87 TaxID=1736243 RepID=UPI0006F970D6|nr:hypothetical protein [Methylobacterium sp. Leaf87]KQO69525.1 hypothetical protein ASF22_02640 [Methylobacterium sp. Leaf87]
MPDPDKYERDFSFEGFQSGNPTSSQPGIRIDDELDTISAAIGGVVDALKNVRRSDGKLPNGIVTRDTLSPALSFSVTGPTDAYIQAQLTAAAAAGFATAFAGKLDVGSPLIELRFPSTDGIARVAKLAVDANGRFGWSDGSWTAYAPVVSAGAGVVTSSTAEGRYVQRGKEVWFRVKVVIVSNGSASGYLAVTLPSPPVTGDGISCVVAGRVQPAGAMLVGVIGETGNSVKIHRFDNTYPATDGQTVVISGTYEAA